MLLVTATTMVHRELAPSVPFVNWMNWVPVTAVNVPPQLFTGAGAGAPAIDKPAGRVPGRVSLSPIPVRGIFPVFCMVMVRSEKSPALIGFGENDLLTLAPGRLVSEASAGCGLLAPFNVVTAPAGMLLVKLPLTFIVMLMVNVQVPNGGRLPPLNEKKPFPAAAVIVPPQVPTDEVTGLAMIIPTGILSVNTIP